MIIEMRTYTLQPGTVATFEERFGQALPARAKVSPLAAFWHTEVGPLNRVIDRWSTHIAERIKLSPLVGAWYSELGGLNKWCHIWAYKDAADRFRIREEARAKGIWPPPSGGG